MSDPKGKEVAVLPDKAEFIEEYRKKLEEFYKSWDKVTNGNLVSCNLETYQSLVTMSDPRDFIHSSPFPELRSINLPAALEQLRYKRVVSTATFTKFPELPRELQTKIWKLSLASETKIVQAYVTSFGYYQTPEEWLLPYNVSMVSDRPPPLLHVCYHSRSLALKKYTHRIRGGRFGERSHYFDPKTDIFFISHCPFIVDFSIGRRRLEVSIPSEVKNVAIDDRLFPKRPPPTLRSLPTPHVVFRNLKSVARLTLVRDAREVPHHGFDDLEVAKELEDVPFAFVKPPGEPAYHDMMMQWYTFVLWRLRAGFQESNGEVSRYKGPMSIEFRICTLDPPACDQRTFCIFTRRSRDHYLARFFAGYMKF